MPHASKKNGVRANTNGCGKAPAAATSATATDDDAAQAIGSAKGATIPTGATGTPAGPAATAAVFSSSARRSAVGRKIFGAAAARDRADDASAAERGVIAGPAPQPEVEPPPRRVARKRGKPPRAGAENFCLTIMFLPRTEGGGGVAAFPPGATNWLSMLVMPSLL